MAARVRDLGGGGQATGRGNARFHSRQGSPLRRRRKRGAHANVISRSRGGRAVKIHALVDGLSRTVAFAITSGQRGEALVAADLILGLRPSRTSAADCACDSDTLRALLLTRGTCPVIPVGHRRKQLYSFDARVYQRRDLVERAPCRLRDSRRIATLLTTILLQPAPQMSASQLS